MFLSMKNISLYFFKYQGVFRPQPPPGMEKMFPPSYTIYSLWPWQISSPSSKCQCSCVPTCVFIYNNIILQKPRNYWKNSLYILNVKVLYLLENSNAKHFFKEKKNFRTKTKPLDFPQQLSIWYLCVFKIKNENNLPGPQTQGDHALLLLFHSFRALSSRSLC